LDFHFPQCNMVGRGPKCLTMSHPLLITGAGGQLGSYLLRELVGQKTAVSAWTGSQSGERFGIRLRAIDLTHTDQVAAAFRELRPTAVLHAAAVSSVAACWQDPQLSHRVNVEGTCVLAKLAHEMKARLLLVSTDLVFDGEQPPYREDALPCPLSVYGQSKREAEREVLAFPEHTVARVSLLFGPGPGGRLSFFDQMLRALRDHQPLPLFVDEWRTPLALDTAARALVHLLRSDVAGLIHVGGPERLSRYDMGRRLAGHLRVDPSVLQAAPRAQMAGAEPRPRDVSLDSSQWRRLFPQHPWPGYEAALAEMGLT
jgi:dTDP-4-dehydrorhamnose reductase